MLCLYGMETVTSPTQYWRGATDDALLTIQCAVRCWFAFVEVGLRKVSEGKNMIIFCKIDG